MRVSLCLGAIMLIGLCAGADFSIEDEDGALLIKEGDKPVLLYHYTMVQPSRMIKERYRRMAYIHPLYGLDGEVLTQDFPIDHFHHRGVFWAWPNSTVEDKGLDIWALDGVRQVHQKFLTKEATADSVTIGVENVWLRDEAPEAPQMREQVTFTVLPEQENKRAIDFTLTFENISGKPIIIRGATTDNKGYGGFCFRPDARRKPMQFTSANGVEKEDILRLDSPWADVTFKKDPKEKALSGVAIFQHPSVPGYPHPGWILRHYGFLGVSWPHTEPLEMQPGDSFTLRYRMLIHRDDAEKAGVAQAFATYTEAAKKE